MPAKSNKNPAEAKLAKLFLRYLYAARKDIEDIRRGEGLGAKYSPFICLTIDTLEDPAGREKVYLLKADEVPQILSQILADLLEVSTELVKSNPADLTEGNLPAFLDDIDATNGVSNMFRFAHDVKLGTHLQAVGDPEGWLTSKFMAVLGPLNPNVMIRAVIETEFTKFMKASALKIALLHEGLERPIDCDAWNSFALAFDVFPLNVVYNYKNNIRVRVVTKKKNNKKIEKKEELEVKITHGTENTAEKSKVTTADNENATINNHTVDDPKDNVVSPAKDSIESLLESV